MNCSAGGIQGTAGKDKAACWSISGTDQGQTFVSELLGHVGGGGHDGTPVWRHDEHGHGHQHSSCLVCCKGVCCGHRSHGLSGTYWKYGHAIKNINPFIKLY